MSELLALARGVILTGFDSSTDLAQLRGFAGVVLFSRNGESVAQVRALTDRIREAFGEQPPIVAIDQEGGKVARLREGVETIPAMMEIGSNGEPALAEAMGEKIAYDLRRAGCTLDFAPVLDLALDPRNTVIGTRSFGSDAQLVARFGQAFARGLQRGGITPCYKHFPGHGATAVDSHEALPTIEAGEQTLRERDLVPFAAVARTAPAIMTAHVLVPSLDPDRPATLSRRILTGLLRAELGFQGAIVTDCLEMNALHAFGPVRAAVEALAAGADLLLFSHSPDRAQAAAEAIVAAVEGGALSHERLSEAHERVLALSRYSQPVRGASPSTA